MKPHDNKLFSLKARSFAMAGAVSALAAIFFVLSGLDLLYKGELAAWAWPIPCLFLFLAAYLAVAAINYLQLVKEIFRAVQQHEPGANALALPLLWSNGIFGQEKAYRDLQKNCPAAIEQVRYACQFGTVVKAMLGLLPGMRGIGQRRLIRSFLRRPGPLRVRPQIQPYVWGQQARDSFIIRFLQAPLHHTQLGLHIAELWFGAHPKNPGRIGRGGQNMDLDAFCRAAGEALLGAGQKEIKQLFKVLDAREPLSLQMHERRAPDSKNECWTIVIDEERLKKQNQDQTIAELYLGFRPIADIDETSIPGFKAGYMKLQTAVERRTYFRKQYAQALQQGITDKEGRGIKGFCNHYLLRWEAGQAELYLNNRKQDAGIKRRFGLEQKRMMVNVPGATVHALYFGVIFESQETADKTLRLYDQGRNDPNRPLHIEQALEQLDFTPRPPLDYMVQPVAREAQVCNLICTPLYALDAVDLTGTDSGSAQQAVHAGSTYQMLIVTESRGQNTLAYAAGRGKMQTMRQPLKQGDMLVVPASMDKYVLSANGRLQVLVAYAGAGEDIKALQHKRGKAFWETEGTLFL